MLGAIIGDIVGSIYEWNNIKTKDFPLFKECCFFTDDSLMTLALAEALMQGEIITRGEEGGTSYGSIYVPSNVYIECFKKWVKLYPNSGYGISFNNWLNSTFNRPYNSWGNGSAMRVSPCSWIIPIHENFQVGLEGILDLAKQSAEISHNHPEGVKGAQATAMAIFYARHGKSLNDIASFKDRIRRDFSPGGIWNFNYDLERTLEAIRPTYHFNESCQETVPEAIIAFLESTGFEDAIRNAISLGGDSDTLTAITGSIAEAAYGIPEAIRTKALSYLDTPLMDVYIRWCETVPDYLKETSMP